MPDVLIVAPQPDRAGGVATVIQALDARLGEAQVVHVGRSMRAPWAVTAGWANVWARGGEGRVLHLNTSVRPRALARDATLLAGWRGPAVAWLHGWSDRTWSWLAGPGRPLVNWFCRRAVPVVLAPVFAERLSAVGVPESRIRIIPPPFRSESVCGHGDTNGDVLFVGRLVPNKGPMVALQAVLGTPALSGRRLTVVGEGPERVALMAAAAAGGNAHRLRCLGACDAAGVRQALSESAVLVLPTKDDAVPVVLIEAMASGIAVVASPVGGIPWLVGEAGVLAAPEPRAVGRALVRATKDISQSALVQAQARMHRDFSADAVASKWRALYGACAPEPHREDS